MLGSILFCLFVLFIYFRRQLLVDSFFLRVWKGTMIRGGSSGAISGFQIAGCGRGGMIMVVLRLAVGNDKMELMMEPSG
jgi:hypothetical protein